MSTRYELAVEGHLDRHWSTYLGPLTLRHEVDGTSTLTSEVADQAQLHGILAGLRDLGASLVSIRAVPDPVEPLVRVTWPVGDRDGRALLSRFLERMGSARDQVVSARVP